eukprot:2187732-Rhodomonas_salina.1
MAESTAAGQYLFDAAVDRNTGETGKIQRQLLDIVSNLPVGVTGYRIAADNLFNSVDACKKVGAAGHTIYGTMRPDRG